MCRSRLQILPCKPLAALNCTQKPRDIGVSCRLENRRPDLNEEALSPVVPAELPRISDTPSLIKRSGGDRSRFLDTSQQQDFRLRTSGKDIILARQPDAWGEAMARSSVRGRLGGRSLYMKDGKPAYTYNFLGLK